MKKKKKRKKEKKIWVNKTGEKQRATDISINHRVAWEGGEEIFVKILVDWHDSTRLDSTRLTISLDPARVSFAALCRSNTRWQIVARFKREHTGRAARHDVSPTHTQDIYLPAGRKCTTYRPPRRGGE